MRQLKLPLEIEKLIDISDPVYTFCEVMDHIDLSRYFVEKGYKTGRPRCDAQKLIKVILFAFMENGICSLREIEKLCRNDIRYMYLLDGMKTPSFATFGNLIRNELTDSIEQIFEDINSYIFAKDHVDLQHTYIDGTKIEANANRYTWVWKKSCVKNRQKVFDKISLLIDAMNLEVLGYLGIKFEKREAYAVDYVSELLTMYKETTGLDETSFVSGRGHRKSIQQKQYEELHEYLERLKSYAYHIETCGEERNSYSKTDPDATFMRMKEDAMRNGQLKPAYNIQHRVDSEYITWIDISPRPTDTCTLIPFLKDMESHLGFKYSEIVADAGYESEENYLFIEGNGQTAYIKPQNYEISKTRKYKKDISRRENMEYHADRDSYICRNGRELTVTNERRSKTASGYVSVKTYYRSPDCTGCPYKTECIKGNNCKTPMEKRNKVLMVSKTMSQKRAEDLERITSEYGTMLRMNRSIQAEGSFADVKEDMNFRRYLYRGKANALAESILLAMGRNINKLHCKIQTGRTESYLFPLKRA